jgi:hypothetical protein
VSLASRQLEGHKKIEQDPDSETDQGDKGTDPRIQSRTKISWMRKTCAYIHVPTQLSSDGRYC